ncbi:MAG: 23S rRNA (uracil(1939)-C(5))-methyltransferase RlmD [Bacteroidetes bacterium]|nr:23S rRNA (uracil(1939)-C(5))-methyltransferase RlmD [Bacteroidota bacterium]
MGRERRFKKNDPLELRIEDIAFGGQGIARIPTEKGPFVIFVQNTFPGQLVRCRVVKCKSKYAECRLEDVLERAPEEVESGFQDISGAPYTHVPIDLQKKLKESSALDLYKRIGGVEDVQSVYRGFVDSPQHWHYRNKMEYSFSAILHDPNSGEKIDGFGLGFKRRGTWWAVENLDGDSGLFDEAVENQLHILRQWFEDTGLPPWHPPQRVGFYRFLVVRKSIADNTLLFNLVTSSADIDQFPREAFVLKMQELFGERIAGILHTINDNTGERVESREGSSELIFGKSTITESMHGLKFDISMSSFFQTNPSCAERLYAEVIAAIDPANDSLQLGTATRAKQDVVMDLFCGTGTIAQMLVRHTGMDVIGVDIVEEAIADAKKSAERNGTTGIEFHAADVGKFLLEFPEYAGRIRTIVLDPPRSGISPRTLRKVIRLGAPKLVYVSCNPATQARDITTLSEFGYTMTSLKFVDQFPHTAHVEAVAVFEKAR